MVERNIPHFRRAGRYAIGSIPDNMCDSYGNLLRQAVSAGETVTFSVSTLPIGTYSLHIYDGISETPIMQTIIKE